MFVVVSKWEFTPEWFADNEAVGAKAMETIRSWDGVEDAFNFRVGPSHSVAVIKYRDEETYDRLVNGEDSPFAKLAAENGLDKAGTWLWSERGHTLRA